MAPAAPRPPGSGRGPRASVSRARDRRLEAARAAAESRVPGTWRVSPRPGRGPGSAGRCGQSEALPPGRAWAPGPARSWFLSSGLCRSAHGPPPVRIVHARVASQGLAAPGGRRGGGGRLARRCRERPGGRGWVRRSLLHSRPARPAQAVADEAGNFPT